MALLVPAVQRVRESVNRATCQNNMKQVALAVHSFNAEHKCFPRNGSKFDTTDSSTGVTNTSWSFQARILPYLEQSTLYAQGGIDTSGILGNPVTSIVVPVFVCPSDKSGPNPTSQIANDWIIGTNVATTNYKGVTGSNWGYSANPAWNNVGPSGSADLFYVNNKGKGDGIFFRSDILYKMTLRLITDGTSNTFMIGEDVPSRSAWTAWMFGNHGSGTCSIPPNSPGAPANASEDSSWSENYSFRSKHPGGLSFAFADGSVHFIDQAIDLSTYRALATVSGGENVPPVN